jgi:Uncharacterised nucleotidyltransferase
MRSIPVMPRSLFEMTRKTSPAPAFTHPEWRELLAFADRTQLTLHLRGTPGLPLWLVEEIETRYLKNAARRARLRSAYEEVAEALGSVGIDFVLLKGFTHETGFGIDGAARVQYDLDILTLPEDVTRARATIEGLGYAPHGRQSLSAEHSRPLVRPSEWSWRGDYFDPEMPIPVELHGSAWSIEHDRIHPAGMEGFWARRQFVDVNGLQVPAFALVDRLAFAALHVLRHILRHDAKPAHVLELARFLDSLDGNAVFWDQWLTLHPRELRALQSAAFRFAHEWFGGVLQAGQRPAPPIDRWFSEFAWSPVINLSGPNKDTVWLHLALVENWWDRVHVFCDRMIPLRLPHEGLFPRLRYHAGAFAPGLASGLRWWRSDAASTAPDISDWKRRKV